MKINCRVDKKAVVISTRKSVTCWEPRETSRTSLGTTSTPSWLCLDSYGRLRGTPTPGTCNCFKSIKIKYFLFPNGICGGISTIGNILVLYQSQAFDFTFPLLKIVSPLGILLSKYCWFN